jgi:hypothetical protein
MNGFMSYRKKNLQLMRQYNEGEDLSLISVSAEDTPEAGGMIAINPENTDDQWYVGKEFFRANYEKANVRTSEFVSFGEALEALKAGSKITRKGWNGSSMYVYYVPADNYPAQTDAIKGHFVNDLVPYRAYMALKTAQNDIAMWTPSGSDALAEDWFVLGASHG